MRYDDMDAFWRRIFDLEWESVREGSKAIAALILSEKGEILSEGRNRVGERSIPNPRVEHAETEAVRNLDIARHPLVKQYTLVTALEPCPMCLGTLVMGGIRAVEIGARDFHGGAMDLLRHSEYLRGKNIRVAWRDGEFGDVQRAMQAVRELLCNPDEALRARMFEDFSHYNYKGVYAAKRLVGEGWFRGKSPRDYAARDIFDALSERIEAYDGEGSDT